MLPYLDFDKIRESDLPAACNCEVTSSSIRFIADPISSDASKELSGELGSLNTSFIISEFICVVFIVIVLATAL